MEDIDVVMKDGLGLRYAFIGPMETIHLNAEGTREYVEKYGHTVYNVSSDSGPIPTGWKNESDQDKSEVENIAKQLEDLYPMDKLAERRILRDKKLSAIAKLKKEFEK